MSEIKEGTLIKRTYGSGLHPSHNGLFLILDFKENVYTFYKYNAYDILKKEISTLYLTSIERKQCIKHGKYKDNKSGWTTELIVPKL